MWPFYALIAIILSACLPWLALDIANTKRAANKLDRFDLFLGLLNFVFVSMLILACIAGMLFEAFELTMEFIE